MRDIDTRGHNRTQTVTPAPSDVRSRDNQPILQRLLLRPHSLGVADILTLQRLVGNSTTAVLVTGGQPLELVIQRKELSTTKLNLAGELHNISGARRDEEETYTKKKTGGKYWTEKEFKVGIMGTQTYGDPKLLRAEQRMTYLAQIWQTGHLARLETARIPDGGNAGGRSGTVDPKAAGLRR